MEEAANPQDQVTGFWSLVAAGYEAHPGNVPTFGTDAYGRWVDMLDTEVSQGPSDVLDLATGTGFVALILARLGHRVTATDLSVEMLAEARRTAVERKLQIRFRLGDAVQPSFGSESFDVVTCRHLLWTLREPRRAIANWHELLRGGGVVLAIDGFWMGPQPSDDEPEPFKRFYTPSTRGSLPFMHLVSPEPIVDAFDAAGFHEVSWRLLPRLADEATGATPYLVRGIK